ncbi:hypothetical protein [Aquihabitans sp. McL0605]|uniref:hypothetical protein n=1 Tax=Aquihabitans sp. McL0605 TaxID=3415671 RepID=UPI003CF3062E
MADLMVWCAFFGTWLLVAGSSYQALQELHAEELEFDRIRLLSPGEEALPRTSRWWLAFPPVWFVLEHRRREQHRRLVIDAMSDEDYEAVTRYVNKATGWLYVGAGSFLIAVTETYALVHAHDWPIALFWVLLVVMAALCVGNGVARENRSAEHLAAHRR